MAQTTTTTHTVELQKYFSKDLLSQTVQSLRLAEFGKKAPLPTKAGQNSIRWFRYGNPSSAGVATLTEGTVITATRTLALTNVDATLVHYGQVVQITDELQAVEFFNSMEQASTTNAQDAALHADEICRAQLITGTTKRYSKGGSTAATFAGLQGATAAEGAFKAIDALDGVTQLKINRAPMIGGGYVAVAPPQVTRDLMYDSAWLAAKQYSDVKDLYKGEVGSFHGLRFVEATNPWVEDETEGTYDDTYTASGTNAAGGLIYATFMLGGEAFGVPELNGESPYSPKVYITNGADKADPLNQLTNVGFKTWWAAKILNNSFFVVHRSKSAFA